MKKCIDCGREITASSKSGLCRSCCQKGKIAWNKGSPMREETKKKLEHTFFRKGQKIPKDVIEKREKTCREKYGGRIKSKTPEETKRKMRLSTIEYINSCKGSAAPRYNKKAIKIIDEYGKEHGYNFKHAENGGEVYIPELGYWVDGYDEERNVVVEYYEKHHNYMIEKDIRRQKQIEDFLKCEFIILREED